jgi:hypothetical protein
VIRLQALVPARALGATEIYMMIFATSKYDIPLGFGDEIVLSLQKLYNMH